jgi:hypothetical protein
MTKRKIGREPLLRIRSGQYVSLDGRFYADRVRGGWCVMDAGRKKYVEQVQDTLAACRNWMLVRRSLRTLCDVA